MSKNLLGTIVVVFVAAVVLTFGATNTSAGLINAIQNGSFETSSLLPFTGTWYNGELAVGTTANLPNWYVVKNDKNGGPGFRWYFEQGGADSKWPNAQDGLRYLNFCQWSGQTTPESVSQSFAVTAGTRYDVSYYTRYRTAANCKVDTLVTLAGGGISGGTLSQASSSTAAWAQNTFYFIPTANTTATLKFSNGVPFVNVDGSYLDNVSVMYIPEPGTLALLAAGLLGLLCYAWRKRR